MLLVLRYLWPCPYTLAGALIGMASLANGGKVRRVAGVLEFHGGLTTWFLSLWLNGQASAMTLGHVILGRSDECLRRAREHELVHVRQYERWGVFFGPAYLGCSLALWLAGRRAYWDNPFEKQAYREAP